MPVMNELAIVYAVFPSAGEALDCCRALLAEGLIACANRLPPVISHYRWEGEVETAEEHPVILKTTTARQGDVIDRVARLHRHKVPAIMSWQVDVAHPAYAQWVAAEVSA